MESPIASHPPEKIEAWLYSACEDAYCLLTNALHDVNESLDDFEDSEEGTYAERVKELQRMREVILAAFDESFECLHRFIENGQAQDNAQRANRRDKK